MAGEASAASPVPSALSPVIGGADRLRRLVLLDASAYRELADDWSYTVPAAVVVAGGAIAAEVGMFGGDNVGELLYAALTALLAWLFFVAVVFFLGGIFFESVGVRANFSGALSGTGFAQLPRLLLIFGVIPYVGLPLGIGVFIWVLAASVVAIREGMAAETTSAIRLVLVAFVLLFVLQLGLFLLFDSIQPPN